MMRSRLRSPISKSMTATFLPRRASPQDRLAEVVVFPTPPLPEVTTMISVNGGVSSNSLFIAKGGEHPASVADFGELQVIAREPRLNRHAGELRRNRFEHTEHAGNRHELSVEGLAEHPCVGVAMRSRHYAAAQRSVDVHATICHHFRASGHCSRDDQIAVTRVDALT